MESTTDESVESLEQPVVVTEGFQPFRKLFHAKSAALISAALTPPVISQIQASHVLISIFLEIFTCDLIRRNAAEDSVACWCVREVILSSRSMFLR